MMRIEPRNIHLRCLMENYGNLMKTKHVIRVGPTKWDDPTVDWVHGYELSPLTTCNWDIQAGLVCICMYQHLIYH